MSNTTESPENTQDFDVPAPSHSIEDTVPGAPPQADDQPQEAEEKDPYAEFAPWKERVEKLFQMNKVPVPENADLSKPFDDGLTPWNAFLVIKSRAE